MTIPASVTTLCDFQKLGVAGERELRSSPEIHMLNVVNLAP